MRSRAWITGGIVVTMLGLAVVLLIYPLSPRGDPAPVQVFAGSSDEPDVILVKEPGSYAIWQLGTTGSDRCRVSTRSGSEIRVDEPRLTVRWEPQSVDSDNTYTQVGAFDAPTADAYTLSCTTDDAPVTAFAVTRTPQTGLPLTALVTGAAAVALGAATAVVAVVRRRR